VVCVPISVPDFTAVWSAYLDGRLINTKEGFLPQNIRRNSALIGRSNWESNGDGMFAANIDAIRVYDYALTAQHVTALYALANDPNGTPRPPQSFYSSSSSSSSSTGAVRRSSSSSTAAGPPLRRCPWWAQGTYYPSCRCPFGGTFPSGCWCDVIDGFYPEDCPNDVPDPYDPDPWTVSSTGVSGGSSGMSTATIAAIIFIVVACAAVAAFIYYRYFRRPATSDILNLGSGPSDGKAGLLAGHTGGMSDRSTNGGSGVSNGHSNGHSTATSAPTGLDYYLAPDTTTQPAAQPSGADGHVEVRNVV